MDWFKGKFTGKTHISWEHLWFPVGFPLHQSFDRGTREKDGKGQYVCPTNYEINCP
jgi:hypothetical protein